MTPEAFIRKISHDLRAPLRAIREMPEWLEEDLRELIDEIPDHITETTSMMKVQARRLDAMMSGLSDLARLRRHKERPTAQIDHVFDPTAWAGNMQVQISVPALPMEEDHARQVIYHLLDNAFRHSGGVDISVVLEINQQSNEYWISVTDTGPGVEECDLELVYEPLSTLRPRDEVEGSGMGLAIVAGIADLYKGRAFMARNPAGGVVSTFCVPDVPEPA